MIQPLVELLAASDPWLSEALVPLEARRRIAELAARLPAAWSRTCLECRLLPGEGQVDVLVCGSRGDGSQRALSAWLGAAADTAVLGSTRPFLRQWALPGSVLAESVPVVWLEYDLHAGGAALDPFVFMTLAPGYLGESDRTPPASPGLPPAEVRALAEEGLRHMLGAAPDPASLATFERCAELLPPGGYMLHLTTMPQRGKRELRVSALLAAHADVIPWLRRIGWPGDESMLRLVLDLVSHRGGQLAVHYELGDTVRAEVGVDYHLPVGPDQTPAWGHFLDRIVDLGACDRVKGQAALDWMGDQRVDLPAPGWPVRVHRRPAFKMRVRGDGTLEVKAYLLLLSRYTLF